MPANELQIVISALDKASDVFSKVGDNFKKAGDKMIDVGKNLTKKVTTPILGVGAAALKVTSDMEQNKIAFDVLLKSGDKASEMLKDLSDFAAKTPFDLPGVVNASKQLLAYGYTQEQIIPTMKMLGDVAAGVGAPVGDLAYLFGTLKAQGKAMTIDIRQFANRGIPIWENLAAVMGETVERTQEMVTEGKIGYPIVEEAFRRMTSEGGQFYNLMEAQSKSFGGVMSNIKDNLVRVGMAMMGLSTDAETYGQIIEGGLFDVIKTGAEKALEKLNEFTTWFTNLSPEMKKVILVVAGLAAALGPVLIFVGMMAQGFSALIGVFGMLMGPVGAVILVITALGLLAYEIYKNWDWIGPWFSKLWNNIKWTVIVVVDWFKSIPATMGEIVNGIVEWFKALPGRIWDAIKNVGSIIVNAFKNIHIPMPHFSLGTEYKKFLGASIPTPKFIIDWYKEGGIFNRPSIIGVGEAGPEAVVPLNKAGLGTVNITVTGNTFMGIEDFAEQIDKILMEKLRTNLRIV